MITMSPARKKGIISELSSVERLKEATLFALTFYAVDDCGGKLDIKPTRSPKGTWRKLEPAPDVKTKTNGQG